MTTFGVDVCAHVKEMHREVPYIITKCTEEIEARGIDLKVCDVDCMTNYVIHNESEVKCLGLNVKLSDWN